MTCDAHHDGHNCATPGACARALTAMCERVAARGRAGERQPDTDPDTTYSLDPTTWKAKYP